MNNIKAYNANRRRAKIARQKASAKPFKVVVYNINDLTRATVERFATYKYAEEYRDVINRNGGSVRAYIE